MHLKFLRDREYLFWDELGCLAKAFGFPCDVFYSCIPDEYTCTEQGLSFQVFLEMADSMRYFGAALDRTFNIHTDQWNLNVIKRSLPLVDSKVFSFEELRAIRVAYQTYESTDTKGMCTEETRLLRALKMCGRMISPLKMMNRIKHMKKEEPGRLQLDEFLDLLLWADEYEVPDVDEMQMERKKNDRNLFQVSDFQELLTHHDKKLQLELDTDYVIEERRFSKVRHVNDVMPRDVPPVDAQFRKQQVRHHNNRYKELRSEVHKAQDRVYQAKAGYVRNRPISAPDVLQKSASSTTSRERFSLSRRSQRPQTVKEIACRYIRSQTPAPPADVRAHVPRLDLDLYERPPTPVAVTSRDITGTRHTIDALNFQQETIEMKYQQILNEELEYHVPNYRERKINKSLSDIDLVADTLPVEETQRQKKKATPDYQRLHQMAYHTGVLSPSHARACDARFRGWTDVSTQRGSHFVLTAPSFVDSPSRRMEALIYRRTAEMSGRGEYAVRYTRGGQEEKQPGKYGSHNTGRKKPVSHHGDSDATKRASVTSEDTEKEPGVELSVRKDPETRAGTRSRTQRFRPSRRSNTTSSMTTGKHSSRGRHGAGVNTKRRGKKMSAQYEENIMASEPKITKEKDLRLDHKDTQEVSIRVTQDSNEEENVLEDHVTGAETGTGEKNHGSVYDAKTHGSIPDVESRDSSPEEEKRCFVSDGSVRAESRESRDTSDDILLQLTNEIDRLREKAPDWLSAILLGSTSGVEPTNKEPSFVRLAKRAGKVASVELKNRLMSPTV